MRCSARWPRSPRRACSILAFARGRAAHALRPPRRAPARCGARALGARRRAAARHRPAPSGRSRPPECRWRSSTRARPIGSPACRHRSRCSSPPRHVAAFGAWLGCIVVALREQRGRQLARPAVLAAVVLVLSGSGLALAHIPGASALIETAYGATLGVKLALVALAFAARSRRAPAGGARRGARSCSQRRACSSRSSHQLDRCGDSLAWAEGGGVAPLISPARCSRARFASSRTCSAACPSTREGTRRSVVSSPIADATYALPVPEAPLPLLAPLRSVVPGQLFAAALARAKGLDADSPTGPRQGHAAPLMTLDARHPEGLARPTTPSYNSVTPRSSPSRTRPGRPSASLSRARCWSRSRPLRASRDRNAGRRRRPRPPGAQPSRWQAECDRVGLANRPHVKTHKCVEIARRQVALGARRRHLPDAFRGGDDGRRGHR